MKYTVSDTGTHDVESKLNIISNPNFIKYGTMNSENGDVSAKTTGNLHEATAIEPKSYGSHHEDNGSPYQKDNGLPYIKDNGSPYQPYQKDNGSTYQKDSGSPYQPYQKDNGSTYQKDSGSPYKKDNGSAFKEDNGFTNTVSDPESQVTNGSVEVDRRRSQHVLTVSNLSYTVRTWTGSWWACGCCRTSSKQVLNKLNLSVRSGQIVAFIGNSGSGKTSLLDVIAGRHSGRVEGDVLLDNKKLTSDLFTQRCAYVIQNDRLMASLTVRESLLYTARLTAASKANLSSIHHRVDECLSKMSLQHVADSKVGGLIKRGISGGERRRLSVALQLLQDPDLLVLDEPTTGLDSYTAHYLVKTLASLAHNDNKMIVMAIHQPRSDIYHLLDTVGILSGGNMVYYGPRKELVSYHTGLGYPCPRYSNPLDFYIDIASMDYRSTGREERSADRVQVLHEAYHKSPLFTNILAEIEAARTDSQLIAPDTSQKILVETGDTVSVQVKNNNSRSCGFRISQFFGLTGILFERMFVYISRDYPAFINRSTQQAMFALFVWLFCWKLENDVKGIQDRIGAILQCVTVSCGVGLLTAVANFPVMRDIYYRESQDGLYGSVHFLMAYYLHILPFQLFSSLIFSIWIYWGIGLNPEPERFAILFVVITIQQHIGEIQTIWCMGLFFNWESGRIMSNLLLTLSGQYASGLIKSTENLIAPLKYLTYINYAKYASQVLVANEFVGLEFTCRHIAPNCTFSGDAVAEGIFPGVADNFNRNLGILVGFVGFYWLLTICTFLARGRKVLH